MLRRRNILVLAAVTAVLFVVMTALDQADEDSTLGTLADWTWMAFMLSALLLIVAALLSAVGRVRAARST